MTTWIKHSRTRSFDQPDNETDELVVRFEQNGDYIMNSEKVEAQNNEYIKGDTSGSVPISR